MTVKLPNSRAKLARSILKTISIPLGISLFFISTSQSAMAQSLWANSSDRSSTQLIERNEDTVEQSGGESTREDVPDVVIGEDGRTSEPNEDTSTSANGEPRFTCEQTNGGYTVMYHPESRPDEAYAWAVPREMGGGWSEERRCNEISRRLESYRPDGLQEMRTAVENGYNTVCVTTQKDGNCRIVFTVPDGQDPMVTRDRVFENLTIADDGQQTQGVNTLTDKDRRDLSLGELGKLEQTGQTGQTGQINQIGRILGRGIEEIARGSQSNNNPINLRPFLDPADGGTGTKLQGSPFKNSHSSSRSQQLKPDNFR
jgi:hypothetical protein